MQSFLLMIEKVKFVLFYKATTPYAHTTPRPKEPKTPDGCKGSFDAVAFLRQELFIFKQHVSGCDSVLDKTKCKTYYNFKTLAAMALMLFALNVNFPDDLRMVFLCLSRIYIYLKHLHILDV